MVKSPRNPWVFHGFSQPEMPRNQRLLGKAPRRGAKTPPGVTRKPGALGPSTDPHLVESQSVCLVLVDILYIYCIYIYIGYVYIAVG